ncbi:unnamed protein product [Linum tenue]|uniref:Major facilitator superfamily (MFS) profile domain-containing protein n=1 Tax=Linum tenue TaxID=586396 RepID=A0AAV0GPU2_9ROSI|nr:unnamed protein product [Linum tenue]
MGIPGWRVAFHLVAIISVVVGILVRLFAHDPQFSEDNNKQQQNSPPRTFVSEMKELMREARSVMKIPSFQIIVAQGVSGSFPWSALSFAPMWLELVGFSHEKTALLMTFFTVAISIGALFGGIMGDALAKRLPNSGRIILSQISSGSAIPLAAVLLLVLPDDPSTGFIHGLVLFVMGLSISWNSPATNKSELQQLDDDYGDDEQTVMDIEYGKEDEENNVGLDESDEKSLLSDDQVSKLDHR